MPRGPEAYQPRLVAMFAGEIADRTRSLEDGLLALGDLPPQQQADLLDALRRDAHTLKGSAALMGAPRIVRICHQLEDEMEDLRSHGRIDGDLVTRLLREVDAVRAEGEEFTGRGPAGPPPQPAPGPAVPPPTAPRTPTPGPSAPSTVRLPTRKLDGLISGVAELRTATSALGASAGGDRRLTPLLRGVDRAVAGIDRAVRDVATVPVDEACEGLARTARDIATDTDKQVQVRVAVGDAEMDRRAVGVVRDALLHLVRNAVSHGIEGPRERKLTGKPASGTVTVSAEVHGERVEVTVSDDGRGIDTAAVLAAAGVDASAADAHELVFTAGLSTAATTSEVSGRGVGLDAVRERVESLGGTVTLRSQPGLGTDVTLVVPTSLATARVLLVESGGETIALLTAAVKRIVRVTEDDVVVSDGGTWLQGPDDLLPLVELTVAAGLDVDARPVGERGSSPAVIVETSTGASTALLVDQVVGEQELLVQPVGRALADLPAVVGAGLLGSGRVVLLLHPTALVRAARRGPSRSGMRVADPGRRRGRVLLVEDAPTTRALEQGLLEAAGFDVVAAEDGRQAWQLLQTEAVDVVVTDVEMPNLDGIGLCERIRGSSTLQELPVIVVSSHGGDEDRRRGAEAGADAYLIKSSFAQGDLVAAIERSLT